MYNLQLKRLREERGLTQEQLAARLDGVSKNVVSFWETGRTALKLNDVCALADVLEVSLDELMGRTPPITDAAARIAEAFSQLDPVGQARAEAYMDGLGDKT